MTDQTPEGRLAAEMQLVYERSVGVNGDPVTWWQAFAREVMRGLAGRPLDDEQPDVPLAIGPAADLTLAAAVQRLPKNIRIEMQRGEDYWYVSLLGVQIGPQAFANREGHGPTLTAAITEALRDE